jgi:mycothiol synthase
MNIFLKEFDPKTATDKDWSDYHVYRRIRSEETKPGEDMLSDNLVEKAMKSDNPIGVQYYYHIYKKDNESETLIGRLGFGKIKEDSPSYKGNEHLAQFDISILNDYQHKGIGSRILHKIMDLTKLHDKNILLTGTENDSGKGFLNKLRAPMSLAGAENRMDIEKLDWELMKLWVKDGESSNSDTKLVIVDDLPEDIIESFAKTYTFVSNQQPLDDLKIGEIIITPEVLRKKKSDLKDYGATWLISYTFESDGTVSGLSELIYFPDRSTFISQDLTGVLDSHRGRGYGKWLKAANIIEAKKRFPQVKTVTTGNAESNAAMLSINKRMGFYKHKESIMSQFEISLIEEYLKENPCEPIPESLKAI